MTAHRSYRRFSHRAGLSLAEVSVRAYAKPHEVAARVDDWGLHTLRFKAS